MVSLRRRKLLGLCSGKSSFLAPLPRDSDNVIASETHIAKPVDVNHIPSEDLNRPQWRAIAKVGTASPNVSSPSSPEEQITLPKEEQIEKEEHIQSFSVI